MYTIRVCQVGSGFKHFNYFVYGESEMAELAVDLQITGLLEQIHSLRVNETEMADIKEEMVYALNIFVNDRNDMMQLKLFCENLSRLFFAINDRLDEQDGLRNEISSLMTAYNSSKDTLNSSISTYLRQEDQWETDRRVLEDSVIQCKKKIRVLESRILTLTIAPEVVQMSTQTESKCCCEVSSQTDVLQRRNIHTQTGGGYDTAMLYESPSVGRSATSNAQGHENFPSLINCSFNHSALLFRNDQLKAELMNVKLEMEELKNERAIGEDQALGGLTPDKVLAETPVSVDLIDGIIVTISHFVGTGSGRKQIGGGNLKATA
ncbi:hypothetical protein GE061_005515 [Apolygus lucorum]|uniref:Uncharacterized protein n=1 Tax=Apolygus lucorum TaxID=248454 RepID=A0A8S9WY89_APOLU|nr:hypothetical protein GE061_005515 [Apolygus lucorum]